MDGKRERQSEGINHKQSHTAIDGDLKTIYHNDNDGSLFLSLFLHWKLPTHPNFQNAEEPALIKKMKRGKKVD